MIFFVVFIRFIYFIVAKVIILMKPIPSSELVLNPDGSIYHLKLHPEQLAERVIVVGDQGRVEEISRHFDTIEHKVQNREFVTHTGLYRGKRITALSTGIGTDNIDIVMNELDALVNIDLEKRVAKANQQALEIVRIGTSGTICEDIPVDSVLASTHGLGFDGLMHFYRFHANENEARLCEAIIAELNLPSNVNSPYLVEGDAALFAKMSIGYFTGITATASGFYGPQGRQIRLEPAVSDLNERMMRFRMGEHRITNFEMETSALFGLARLLGHKAATVCVIIANRARKEYSKNYKPPMQQLIVDVLDRLSS
jgi:uridine phosphorylase